jgi:hypothetical protein
MNEKITAIKLATVIAVQVVTDPRLDFFPAAVRFSQAGAAGIRGNGLAADSALANLNALKNSSVS